MPSTAFEKRFEEYSAILEELTGSKSMGTEYQAFINSLSQLNQTVTKLGQKDTAMTDEDIRHLREQYENALDSTNQYLALQSPSSLDRKRGFIAKELRELMVKDMNVVSGLDARSHCSMRQAFSAARTIQMDITGQPVNHAGESVSDRIPVAVQTQDGTVRKGFFTAQKRHGDNPALEDFRSRYPQYEVVWALLDDHVASNQLKDALAEDTILNGKILEDPLHALTPEERANLQMDVDFQNILQEYANAYRSVAGQYSLYTALEATEGSSIEDRNCAMTSVATVMNLDSLIAHSEKAVLRNGDQVVQGCFTAHAEGSDSNHLKPNDPMIAWGKNAAAGNVRISPDAIRQLSDLQVLDYICGNADRHCGNLVYKFEEQPGGPVLQGITGIDNDMAFGCSLTNEVFDNSVMIQDMNVISQSMADKVMSLDGDAMEYLLQNYQLSDAEKKAAAQRLEWMQQKILEGQSYFRDKAPGELEEGYLRTVPDEEFGMYSIADLQNTNIKDNLYGRILNNVVPLVSDPQKHGLFETNKPILYTDAVEGSCQPPLSADRIPGRFGRMNQRLQALSKDFLFANSSSFKAMQKALNDIANAGKDADMHPLLDALQEKTQAYITEKGNVPRREAGRARLHLARQLRELCSDVRDEFVQDQVRNSQPQKNSVSQQIKSNIQTRISLCRQRSAAALDANDMPQVYSNITEAVYLSAVAAQAAQKPGENMLTQLSADVMKQGIQSMRPSIEGFVKSMSNEQLHNLVNGENFNANVHRGYLKFAATKSDPNPSKMNTAFRNNELELGQNQNAPVTGG